MKKMFIAVAACMSLLGVGGLAQALTIDLNYTYSGASPSGPAPWVTLTFTDYATDQVKLSVDAKGLIPDEFIGKLYFNFDDLLDVTQLSFSNFSYTTPQGSDVPAQPDISKKKNEYKAGGAGDYDIYFDFKTSQSARFKADYTISYIIGGIVGLDASDFDYFSTLSPNGAYRAAAHIQGIGPNADDSGWIGDKIIPIPEPTVTLLFSLGTLGFAGMVRRRMNK